MTGKIVAITGVGSFPVPWLPFGIASIYNAVDEIVVVNSGYNLPLFTEYDAPLPEVSPMLKELDINGKVHEVQHVTWEKAAKYGSELDSKREGIRALGMTYANDIALYELHADWILRFDSDQVFYPNVKNVRCLADGKVSASDGYEFFEWKSFWLSPLQFLKGGENSYNDGAKFYKAGPNRQWFVGEGGIVHNRPQDHIPSTVVCTGHFRECWFPLKGGEVDKQNLFTYQFQRWLLHAYDQDRLYADKREGWTKKTIEQMVMYAFNTAKHLAYSPWEVETPIVEAPPPIGGDPLSYIREGLP